MALDSPEASDEQGFASRAWDKFYWLHENKFFKVWFWRGEKLGRRRSLGRE